MVEIIKDLGPPAEQKCPNMHLGAADEVQVAAEAHKFQKSSRDQQKLQPLMSDGCRRMGTGPGDGLLMLSKIPVWLVADQL